MSTPIIFETLSLRNFMSFGNSVTEIDLTYLGSTLIQGENVDTGGANGVGKTTIINGLCYALFNKAFDNISLQRLINTTNALKNTQMEVRLTFTKGDVRYEIYRTRGEAVNIQVLQDGQDITLDSVSGNDRLVQEIIGISYELFTKVIIFSGNSTPFLEMPISQQRQQIEELFSITILTEKAVKLKEAIKGTEQLINIQGAVLKEQEGQVTLYQKQLAAAEARIYKWDEDRTKQLAVLADQLNLLDAVNMDEEKELHAIAAEIKSKEYALNTKLSAFKKDLTSNTTELKKLRDELKHLTEDKCPYCLQQFGGAGDKLVEKQELFEQKTLKQAELQSAIEDLDSAITEMVNQRYEADQLMKFASLADAVKAETNSQTAQQKINDLQAAVNPHIDAYEHLLQNAVTGVSYAEIDAFKRDLEHQQFLLKLLTDKNSFIRRKIISRTIPRLNSRLVHYTKELGLPHIVRFDDDMSCTVSEYGRELDFGNLSSGEKKRVNLSMSLAFRDVLHHLHSAMNCLFIDEIDGGLDSIGVENAFKLLKNKSRDDSLGLWLISHRPEASGRFDRTVVIKKENGFSRLMQE